MAKDKLTDYDSSASNNSDVGGVNTAEGMLPSKVNDAIRELMSHLADFSAGTTGVDVLNLQDDDNSASIKFQAPSAVTTTTTFTLPDGDGDAGQALLTDGAGALAWANPASPNLLINGNFAIAQRGTSSTSSGYHSVDRYKVDFLNFDQLGVTQSQSTTVPSGKGFSNSLKVAVTTQETTLDANELFIIRQFIEAQNLQHLAYGTSSAKSLTLSFWVRSSLAGKYSVMFYSADGVRSNLQSFTISSSDTWEFVTIAIDGDTAGTINNDNGAGLQVTWVLAAGTDWTGTPHTGWGAFVQTDDYAFSDQVNFAAQTGEFYITGIQLEVGSVANPVFQHESFAETLQKCQRYYQQSYALGTVAGTATTVGREIIEASGSTLSTTTRFTTEMRATPTVTCFGPQTGATGIDISGSNSVGFTLANQSPTSFRVAKAGTPSFLSYQFRAVSEL